MLIKVYIEPLEYAKVKIRHELYMAGRIYPKDGYTVEMMIPDEWIELTNVEEGTVKVSIHR